MTREELIESLLHFRDAHIQTTFATADALRRMELMEQALTKQQLWQLDAYLFYHPREVEKGDGTEHWVNWQRFKVPASYKGQKA